MKKIITITLLFISLTFFGQNYYNPNTASQRMMQQNNQMWAQQRQMQLQQDQLRYMMQMQNRQVTTESLLLKEEKRIEKTNNKNLGSTDQDCDDCKSDKEHVVNYSER